MTNKRKKKKMTSLEGFYEEKMEESCSNKLLESQLQRKKKTLTLFLTTTAVITGILVLTTILAIISKTISLSTIFVDILMILWHFILLIRIYSIEKELDMIKIDSSKNNKQNDASDEDMDWI